MRDTLKQLYNIEPKALIKCSNNVYQVKCDNDCYCLKYTKEIDDEKICEKLKALQIDYFLIPIQTTQRRSQATLNEKSIKMTPWLQEEYLEAKDIKLKYYLNRIATLHKKTEFSSNVSSSYYQEIAEGISDEIEKCRQSLDSIMEGIERIDYKSPSQWYFTLNYFRLMQSLDNAKEMLNKFKEVSKDKSVIRQVIIHQNFDYNHIFISKDKIISNDKMQISSPVYELKSLFDHSYFGSIDLSGCLKDYFDIFPFEEYEKYWLLSLLFIPNVRFYLGDDFKNLTNIMQSVFMYKSILELKKDYLLKEQT